MLPTILASEAADLMRLPLSGREPGMRKPRLIIGIIVATLASGAGAQTDQVLPEIDVYCKLQSDVRIWFQAGWVEPELELPTCVAAQCPVIIEIASSHLVHG